MGWIAAVRRRVRPGVEELESRLPPSGWQPTAVEQVFLERLNDARANPAAYGHALGLNLAGIAPRQPLAFDPRLIRAARLHSLDMARRNYFEHNTPEGVTPMQRVAAAGFRAKNSAESILVFQDATFRPVDPLDPFSPQVRNQPDVAFGLALLIIDAGVPDLGHRRHLLGVGPLGAHNLIGIGHGPQDVPLDRGFSVTSHYFTLDTGVTGQPHPFLTGAVFRDLNGNRMYDLDEGVSGVKVRVSGVGTRRAFDTGGYTVALPHRGRYRVTVTGGGLTAPQTKTVRVGAGNARLNFIVS